MTNVPFRSLSTPVALAVALLCGSARSVETPSALVLAPVADGKTKEAAAPATAPVDYKFREAPLNAMGIQSLSDLRGKPVVIDFWGRN